MIFIIGVLIYIIIDWNYSMFACFVILVFRLWRMRESLHSQDHNHNTKSRRITYLRVTAVVLIYNREVFHVHMDKDGCIYFDLYVLDFIYYIGDSNNLYYSINTINKGNKEY